MCDSLGKKNFNKVGLAAIFIDNKLQQEAKAAGLPMTLERILSIYEEAIRKASTSPMLKFKRSELEALAAKVKGPHQNWGSFSRFNSSNLSKKSCQKA